MHRDEQRRNLVKCINDYLMLFFSEEVNEHPFLFDRWNKKEKDKIARIEKLYDVEKCMYNIGRSTKSSNIDETFQFEEHIYIHIRIISSHSYVICDYEIWPRFW